MDGAARRIFRIEVVEAIRSDGRNDVGDRQGAIAQNADRQFAPGNEFLDQRMAPEFPVRRDGGTLVAAGPHDFNADGRTFRDWLDDIRRR